MVYNIGVCAFMAFLVGNQGLIKELRQDGVESWNAIIQYRQEYPEKRVLLSNRKWSDSLNSSALSYFVEKGWECYRLLHTPQCDKSLHLHTERGHTWVSLCS